MNCQHIAAIMKGLCVKGVSHDVSLAELVKHEKVKDSDSVQLLKDEYERCKKIMSECLISMDKLKKLYLAEYNKTDEDTCCESESKKLETVSEEPEPASVTS